MRLRIGILALALWGSAARGVDTVPEGYPIKFWRADVVGNTYEIHDSYDMGMTETAASPTHDPVTKKVTKHVDFTGRMTVKAVNEKGQATEVVLKVIRMVRADGRDMIRPGSMIRMTVGPENHVEECSTGPVPDAAMEMINRFIPARGTSDKTIEDIFGSRKPRRANETWGIDSQAASEFFAGFGITASAEEISGKTTVNGLRVDGLMVTTQITVPNYTLSAAMPKDGKLDLCNATTVTQWLLPVDPRAQICDVTMTCDSMASGHRLVTLIGIEARAHEVTTIHWAITARGKPAVGQTASGG